MKKVLMYFLIAVLIIYNAYILTSKFIFKENLPMIFGYAPIVVLSGSMEPAFSKNDVLIIKKSEYYVVGDIVTYSEGPYFITHRILSIDGDKITARGDANNTEDKDIDMSRIRGKVIKVLPIVGIVIKLFKSPIFVLAVIIIFIFMNSIWFYVKKSKEKKEIERLYNELKQSEKEKK